MGWKGKESEKSAVERAGWRRTILAGAISFIYFFPVLWIVLTAFKTERDILAVPAKFLFTPTFDNFVGVFSRAYFGGQATDINDSLLKSVDHTAALGELNATNEAAEAIVAGLARGRSRLGG